MRPAIDFFHFIIVKLILIRSHSVQVDLSDDRRYGIGEP